LLPVFFAKDTNRPGTGRQAPASNAKFLPTPQLARTARSLFAFFLLDLVLSEADEIGHFAMEKIVCGCWPGVLGYQLLFRGFLATP
jgi:hypothetical protein